MTSFNKAKEMEEFQREDVDVEEKMYVAVSKEVEESRSILTWALQNSGGKKVCLIHVHQPAKKISILEKAKSCREKGNEEMFAVPYEYLRISQKFGVQVEKLYTEDDSIEKGIIQLIEQHNIVKLVIGSGADTHFKRKMTEVTSKKASYVRDNAPPFCHIWFVCNGFLINTRKAIKTSAACDLLTPSCRSELPESAEKCVPPSPSKYDELQRNICNELNNDIMKSRQVLYKESVTCQSQNAEEDSVSDAIYKAKTAERLFNKEIKLRKAKEEELAKEKEATENMKNLRLKTSLELQRTLAHNFALEKLNEDFNLCRKEEEGKLFRAVELLQRYKNECEELEMERDNALMEVDNLRVQNSAIALSSSHVSVPVVLSTFSSLDLKKATIDFDDSLKLGEGGYGSTYKGFLRDTKVSVKILNRKSLTHGPQHFDQEVSVLRMLQHPNVVTLVGMCPETCALVYEYLPGGSLEDRLVCKDNALPLSWQTRIQIAIDLCSVLIFLHSSRPNSIIHGNLKPSNVLLDANCVCKLCDFGTRELDYTDQKGTLVHMDPEFLHTGEATPESDVYSFGIILLRLLTGKSANGILMARSGFSKVTISRELDPSAGDWPLVQAEKLARMALRCCDMKLRNRPNLRDDEVMEDPHIASDGFTYEAEAIRGWFDGGHDNSPMTNVTLTNHNLTPNRALRSAIQEWRLHNRSG